MATGWKRWIEVALARSGAAGRAERHAGPSVTVLAYHNIVPDGERPVGDLSLHTDQADFARQLDLILESRRIVPLADALAPGASFSERDVVITFDDAYTGTLTAGVEELVSRGVPATVFVPPGRIGSEGFWWDRLAPEHAGLDPRIRDHALERLGGADDRVMAWSREKGIRAQVMPPHARPAPAALFRELPTEVVLGAHTWSHPNLATLSDEEALDEMRRSRDWLLGQKHPWVDWFAYPYGLLNAGSKACADRLFDGSVLISGGPAVRRGKRQAESALTPRLNVPRGMSLEGLALRLAGLLP